MSAATTIPHGRLAGRGAVVVLLCVAAAAHIPVIPDHLREATYMGLLFVAFTLACLAAAAALVLVDDPRLLTLAAASCGAAVVAYAATRLVAFPQLADDVSNWLEPLGIVAVAAETAVVAICLVRRRASVD